MVTTPVLTGTDAAHPVQVDVTETVQLTLVTDDTGDDNWRFANERGVGG